MDRIQRIFSQVPDTYELVNTVLTFGFDRIWRKRAVREAIKHNSGGKWLDACTGTGQMAGLLRRYSSENAEVIGADFCREMIEKAKTLRGSLGIRFIEADMSRLPFSDGEFEGITISFATRNLNRNRDYLLQCLREFRRVLRQGGRFINLETSQPSSRIIKYLFHGYVKTLVKPVGTLISGSKQAYTYLSHTIPRFYNPDEFKKILLEAGFSRVKYKKLFFGVSCIHIAIR